MVVDTRFTQSVNRPVGTNARARSVAQRKLISTYYDVLPKAVIRKLIQLPTVSDPRRSLSINDYYFRFVLALKRRRRAQQLGLAFVRASSFVVPRTVMINGADIDLTLPNEYGQKVAFIDIFLDDVYELRRLRQVCNVKTIIDVGANTGLFSLAALGNFADCKLHAYEPNPVVLKFLNHHATQVGFRVFAEALGDQPGKAKLCRETEESVFGSTESDPLGEIEQIDLATAVARIGGSVDLIKMDCEGAEWELLRDKQNWERIRYLTMEYHLGDDERHNKIIVALRGLGFHIIAHNHRELDRFGIVLAKNTVY